MELSPFQVAQSEAERDSDKVMEDLIDGKVTNVDEFLEKFMVKHREHKLSSRSSDLSNFLQE